MQEIRVCRENGAPGSPYPGLPSSGVQLFLVQSMPGEDRLQWPAALLRWLIRTPPFNERARLETLSRLFHTDSKGIGMPPHDVYGTRMQHPLLLCMRGAHRQIRTSIGGSISRLQALPEVSTVRRCSGKTKEMTYYASDFSRFRSSRNVYSLYH